MQKIEWKAWNIVNEEIESILQLMDFWMESWSTHQIEINIKIELYSRKSLIDVFLNWNGFVSFFLSHSLCSIIALIKLYSARCYTYISSQFTWEYVQSTKINIVSDTQQNKLRIYRINKKKKIQRTLKMPSMDFLFFSFQVSTWHIVMSYYYIVYIYTHMILIVCCRMVRTTK